MEKNKPKKKSKVVSVRLSEDTYAKFEEIRVNLHEISGTETSQPDLITNMINFYYEYIQNIDNKELEEIQRQALIKALCSVEPEADSE